MSSVSGSVGLPSRVTPATSAVTTENGSMAAVSIADPVPLGLAGFGLTTLALSVVNTGWIPAATGAGVLALAIAFGGSAQLLAGMWAFRRGSTFAATAFSSYGAFWLSYWLLSSVFAPAIERSSNAGAVNAFVGLYLLLWGVFTTYMLIASLAGPKAVTGVFVLLSLTYFALMVGAYWGFTWSTFVGGYLGIATAINALYVSFADVTNANFSRRILPT